MEGPVAPASTTGPNSNDQSSPLFYTNLDAGRQAPSRAAAELCDRLRLELISETMDLVASYATSASEAAWRDDRATLRVHLQQARLSLLTGIEAFKLLGAALPKNEAAR